MIINKISNLLVTGIALVVILIYGQNLITTIIFALLLWFLVRKIKTQVDKIPFVKNKFPSWAKSLIASALLLSILVVISRLLLLNINALVSSYSQYESNILLIATKINQLLNIDLLTLLKGYTGGLNYGSLISSLASAITGILSNAFMILIYTLFIFLEELYFSQKLQKAISNSGQYSTITGIIEHVEKSITDYIGLKTLLCFIAALLSYVVMVIIGVQSALFWACLIFFFYYIPVVGPLLGVAFPALFTLIQFGEFMPFVLVLIIVGGILLLVGNVLEPKLMGNSLNISVLVTIISLSFWGAIWGIVGMILSIPITVILMIILSKFEKTKPIAIMLSEKGELE